MEGLQQRLIWMQCRGPWALAASNNPSQPHGRLLAPQKPAVPFKLGAAVDPVLHVLSMHGTMSWDYGVVLAPYPLRSSHPLLHWEPECAVENDVVLVHGFGLALLRQT